jgi:hypothetical protein
LLAALFAASMPAAKAVAHTNAWDTASLYSSFSGNQGFGFAPWIVNTPGGGAFIASSGPSGKSFDLWNLTANSASTATRAFQTPLLEGGSFSVQLRFNSLDSTSTTNALELLDASGAVLFRFYHVGGDTANGHATDADGYQSAPGFDYNYGKFSAFVFTLNTCTTYTFEDKTTGASINGRLAGNAITQVRFVRSNGNVTLGNGTSSSTNFLSPRRSPISTLGFWPTRASTIRSEP